MTMSGTLNDNEWQRVTTNSNEWYNKWQRVVQRVTTHDNKWQRTNDKSSDNEWQRVIRSDNEWQPMTGSGTTNENEWEEIK